MRMHKLSQLIFVLALFLVLLPHTLYSFVKKRLEQPKLNIKIELSDKSHAQQKWMLEATTEDADSLYVYEIFWHYDLTIKNRSSYTAYDPEFLSNFYLPYYSRIEPLTKRVILPSEKTITKGFHSKMQQCREGEQKQPVNLPKEFDNIKLLLSYQNKHKINFYTVFDVKSGKSTYHRFRPLEFI